MDSWNQGRRHQPSNSSPLLYQQTYQGKLATLRSLAAHIDGVRIIDDSFQPSLRTSDIEARCAWNDADSVTLTLHKLTPEQAIAALKAIKGA